MKKTLFLLFLTVGMATASATTTYTVKLYADGCTEYNTYNCPAGQALNISAVPDAHYYFTQWNDGNTQNPRSIVVNSNQVYIANFAIDRHTFGIQTSNASQGVVTSSYMDGTYDYGTPMSVEAIANYGYHFDYWMANSGSSSRKITQNPYSWQLGEDISLIAYFAKNTYRITASATHGRVTGAGKFEYQSSCSLVATPYAGYHFTQWTDGNTDNPREVILTQDTSFTAEFAVSYQGQCGTNLSWEYNHGVLTITGSGAMDDFTSTTMPWEPLRDSITDVVFPAEMTSIGAYAFYNCTQLKSLAIPTAVNTIGNYAFYGCINVRQITCYATNPPVAGNYTFSGLSQYTKVYVLASALEDYQFALGWRDMTLLPIEGKDAPVTTDDVVVIPTATNATFTWPANDQAAGYSLEITKDGEVFCTLTFNANGQLTGIAFAPGRDGQNAMPAAEMTANGWQFTVTGLNQASKYGYSLDALNAAQQSIKHYEGEFATDGYTTDLQGLTMDNSQCKVKKFIHEGKLYIRRDGKIFNAQGALMQ